MTHSPKSTARLLVIDDEPDLRTLYELTLQRAGYQVQTAGDVQQARTLLQQQLFDVVITDMRPMAASFSACTWFCSSCMSCR